MSMDESLLQDFLTESSELIEQLDSDLVSLESVGDDSEAMDLLNGIFRALHTIKGAASFLSLNEVTTFAHAAEDALNKLRKGEAEVNENVMDALLRSTDVIRNMIDELNEGNEVTPGPNDLVESLLQIAAGEADTTSHGAAEQSTADAEHQESPTDNATPQADENAIPATEPLELPPQKEDLVEFMVSDLEEACKAIDEAMTKISNDATRDEACDLIREVCTELEKTLDFFELDALTSLVKVVGLVGEKVGEMCEVTLQEAVVRVKAVSVLLNEQSVALTRKTKLIWPLETLERHLKDICEGKALPEDIAGQHGGNYKQVLLIDRVLPGDSSEQETMQPDAVTTAPPVTPAATPEAEPGSSSTPTMNEPAATKEKAATKETGEKKQVTEQTIRVEVSRLESLLNLVGQLVLNKNRFIALTRQLGDAHIPHDLLEDMTTAAGELDRTTSELQTGVMRTRMQPLAKLFDRYPRVIRDMARMTEKKINLEVRGKETEVDKSVLELLADPLVHILRNSADHGVEAPDVRVQNGKSETGTIRLAAEHQGSHVRVEITDDGKGLDREVLGTKAVEKGLTTQEQLVTMSDEDVFRFIFAAGFSTAAKVSDLSGRGVGMDVVRTNINKMNGTINVSSAKGKGTTIEILIPLTVAIMPAMVVGVGDHLYAVPLQAISEIVRPEQTAVHSIHGQPVMRLRDSVLPLVNLQSKLDETEKEDGGRFAVVVGVGGQRAGLLVDRLIGQQEIVIKPLDDAYTKGGPFSGATIRENGEVSLILDVVQLLRQTPSAEKLAA